MSIYINHFFSIIIFIFIFCLIVTEYNYADLDILKPRVKSPFPILIDEKTGDKVKMKNYEVSLA